MAGTGDRALVALRDWAAHRSTTDDDLAARPLRAQIAGDVDAYLDPDATPVGPSLFEDLDNDQAVAALTALADAAPGAAAPWPGWAGVRSGPTHLTHAGHRDREVH